MQVQDHALLPLILGQHPGSLAVGKIMLFDDDLPAQTGAHQAPQGILTLADGFQGAVLHQGRQPIQLCPDILCGQSHIHPPFRGLLILVFILSQSSEKGNHYRKDKENLRQKAVAFFRKVRYNTGDFRVWPSCLVAVSDCSAIGYGY